MSPRKWNRLKIFGSAWVAATVLSVITGFGVPGIFNYVDHIEYSSPQIEVQGLYIRPSMKGRTYSFTFPLLYSYWSIRPPYSIGIEVTDSANGNQCRELVIDELIVTVNRERKVIVKSGESVSSSFERYLSGHTGVTAHWYVELEDLVSAED